jgi:ABC-2 type transport system ATP-binding protein
LPEAIIEFSKAQKNYSNKRIGPIDLVVNRGEITGFLGPNGSGKTTCIRLILGLIKASSGEVMLNGNDPISKHTFALKDVGYSPELPNLQPFFTPKELLTLLGRAVNLSSPFINKEITRVLELVGLAEYVDVKIGKMSKGMVQRLSIAQSMMGSPRLLILDEPMIGLDPAGTAHLRETFRNFAKANGGTVFLSSHQMSEVENLCDRIVMIHSGKIVASGMIKEVTRKLLGYSSITFEADNVSEECLKKIRSLSGVGKVVGPEGRVFHVEIVDGSEEELRPKISEIIVDSNAKLYAITPTQDLLERAYIQAISESSN